MNDEKAQQLIVLATLVTLGSTSSALLVKPKNVHIKISTHRVIVGGLLAMFFCSLVAEVDSTVGVGLAALTAGGAFVKYGAPTINSYYQEGNKKK
jgi:uncharacterized membrane protein